MKYFGIALFSLSFILSVYPLLVYPWYIRRKSLNNKLLRTPDVPKITVIVPVFNEENFIRDKIINIKESNYPPDKVTIVVVDNSSTDNTASIAESMDATVLHSKRGKVFAINEALKKVDTDVVIITDVDIKIHPDAMKILVQTLVDDIAVASAQIKVEDGNSFYYKSKRNYHDSDWEIRYYESLVDSCCSSDGRIMAVDHRIIDKYPEEALVDDFELTFLVKQKGARAVLNPDAIGWEKCPENFVAEFEQVARRAAIGLLTAWRYKSFLFNKKYGYFGLMIFPVRRFLIFFLPFFIILQAASIVYIFRIWGLLAICGIGIYMLMRSNYYPFIQFVGILKGWWDLILGRIKKGGVWDRYNNKKIES